MNFNRPQRCYDPITLGFLAGGAIAAGGVAAVNSQKNAARKQENAMNAASARADAATAATPQVSDTPKDSAATRIGRAALISTSPLGVQTTDPTGRRKLLGNV